MSSRTLTIGFAAARVAYAGAVIAAPRAAAGPWLGGAVEGGGGRVAARALVARDAIISAGVAVAARREAAVRPWLAACVASDLADIAATLADRDDLPDRPQPAPWLAGAAVIAGLGVALAADG